MTSRRPRYARIKREVAELIKRARIKEPPVSVEAIAKLLGARIEKADFKNEVSGVLARREKNVVIGVDKGQAITRQRFTIAHEIGHLILHDFEEVHVDRRFVVRLRSQISSEAIDVDEIEANAFAAGLLMPEEFIRNDVRRLQIDFEDASQVEALAKRYGVSSQAMTFRLLNLLGD
jgi:Zn-dependent peptidase ImmA (M78 family)